MLFNVASFLIFAISTKKCQAQKKFRLIRMLFDIHDLSGIVARATSEIKKFAQIVLREKSALLVLFPERCQFYGLAKT